MKINKYDGAYGGKWERVWIKYRKVADLYIRYFEINVELITGAGISLHFSERDFKTYNLVPGYFLNTLKKIEQEVQKYNENGIL